MNIAQVNPYIGMPTSFSGSTLGLVGGGSLAGAPGSMLPTAPGDSLSLSGMGGMGGASGMGASGGVLGLLRQTLQMISGLMSMMMGGGLGNMGGGTQPYANTGSPSASSGNDYAGNGNSYSPSPAGNYSGTSGGQAPASGDQPTPDSGQPTPTENSPAPTGGQPAPTGGEATPGPNQPTNTEGAQGNSGSYRCGDGVHNSKSNLPPIDPTQWCARDGQNPGSEFTTPFVSGNVQKSGNSISTKIQGGQGAEARFNKSIGTGFYQFNVNPKTSNQLGEMSTVFLYSNTGSNGGDKQQGFELDAEYNMVRNNSVTFGTWIDGTKYNEVTIDAPKGDQTIGFNIQEGKTQIGYVSPDGSFKVVSETKDPRITKELASHLKPMSNSWRFKDKGGVSEEGSSITINGFGRSDAPGQPVKPV